MDIIYPYNEILPKNRAHDTYIVHQCNAFAESGIDISLLCGKRETSEISLHTHYGIPICPNLHINPLPIIRKNNPFNLSWNFPFFFFSQKKIEAINPNFVFLSVLKQGAYHLKRKIQNVKYIYEVHELAYYPNSKPMPHFELEKKMLAKADLITVTTHQLKEILRAPPYDLKNPIEIIPLAVKQKPLPPPVPSKLLHLVYVGQLYQGQGIEVLLHALSLVKDVRLTIVGGTSLEINHFQKTVERLGIEELVAFLGFHPPSTLSKLISNADVFVSAFEKIERMPYVAHTKLFEYAQWGRPIIAPNLPIVKEHFSEETGALFFKPGDPFSLAEKIKIFQKRDKLDQFQRRISALTGQFSWEKRIERYKSLLKSL